MPANERIGLVGDIGGTNARFAMATLRDRQIHLSEVLALPGHDYPGLEAAARDYLARTGQTRLDAAVFACAGPVVDGSVSFTNVAWRASEASLATALGVPRVHLINDLAAVAWAAPVIPAEHLRRIAGPANVTTPPPAAATPSVSTRAVLNAGTGCNASAHVRHELGDAVVVGEFGHASFAPSDALELKIWQRLAAEFGHVSNERVLAGPGLLNLYRALAAIEGQAAVWATPAEVSVASQTPDPLARRAVETFCAIMGSIAGDVALTFGARGGVYLAGGVAATVLTEPHDTAFRQRFENKGRFRAYLAEIPTLLITDTNAALLGAARAMQAYARRTPPP